MSQETKTHITEVRTINVPVTDQERALDFYVGKLGFEKRLDVTYGPDQRWIEVAPSGATTTVALAPSGGGRALPTAAGLLDAGSQSVSGWPLAGGVCGRIDLKRFA